MEKLITKDQILGKLTLVNILIIALGLGIILIRRSFLPEKVPLFYGRPWGEEQLAFKNWLLVIPLSSVVVFIFNNQIGKFFQKKNEDFLVFVLGGGSLLFSILGTVTVLKIIFLIT